MTQINAQVIADSITQTGDRITTMLVTMPRFILAEFNTHRMFSRNTSSSRAIPFATMAEVVVKDPVIPIAWQKDHKGMQGTEYFPPVDADTFKQEWLITRQVAVVRAGRMYQNGLTKQLANRLLEPFMWTTVIVTATEWDNFFDLRCPQYTFSAPWKLQDGGEITFTATYRSKKEAHRVIEEGEGGKEFLDKLTEADWLKLNKGQAEIHMMALAESMYDAYKDSTPMLKLPGEWHIPFEHRIQIPDEVLSDWQRHSRNIGMIPLHGKIDDHQRIQISTAMCARTSYTVVGEPGKRSKAKHDIELHDMLLENKHMSPFEHCAMVPLGEETFESGMTHIDRKGDRWSGNFRNWIQYRQLIEQNNDI